jgi:hypothetical protein
MQSRFRRGEERPSQVAWDRFAHQLQLGLECTTPGGEVMPLQPQERTQRESYVIAPGTSQADLRTRHPVVLLQFPVLVLDLDTDLGVMAHHRRIHPQVIGRPVSRVTSGGVALEGLDHPVAAEMDLGAQGGDHRLVQRPHRAAGRCDLAVPLQPGQPRPDEVAYLPEVLQAGVPAVEKHVSGREAAGLGHEEQLPEVVVLGPAVGLAEDPVVAGNLAVGVGPQHGDQVNAADGLVVLARPVASDQYDFLSVELVERDIFDDHTN